MIPAEQVTSAIYGGVITLAVWFAGSGALAWWQAKRAHRRGISSDQREARRDTLADRDKLVDALERRGAQLAEELAEYRQQVETLAEGKRAAEVRERHALDYAHALRSDYAAETGKAPRAWPAELAAR